MNADSRAGNAPPEVRAWLNRIRTENYHLEFLYAAEAIVSSSQLTLQTWERLDMWRERPLISVLELIACNYLLSGRPAKTETETMKLKTKIVSKTRELATLIRKSNFDLDAFDFLIGAGLKSSKYLADLAGIDLTDEANSLAIEYRGRIILHPCISVLLEEYASEVNAGRRSQSLALTKKGRRTYFVRLLKPNLKRALTNAPSVSAVWELLADVANTLFPEEKLIDLHHVKNLKS